MNTTHVDPSSQVRGADDGPAAAETQPTEGYACCGWPGALLVLLIAMNVAWTVGVSPASNGSHSVSIFTSEELRAETAKQERLLLVVVGMVYDVSTGRGFYAQDGDESYAGFVGQDASRAFLSADFENNATDDLHDLLPGECLGIEHWQGFYANHSTYKYVGLHHGRFYDASGTPTEELHQFHECVERGHSARRAAAEVVRDADRCKLSDPPIDESPSYAHGEWRRYTCLAPLVPRGVTIHGESEKACVCLRRGSASEVGWEEEPEKLAMQDDLTYPQRYGVGRDLCALDAHVCTVRVG